MTWAANLFRFFIFFFQNVEMEHKVHKVLEEAFVWGDAEEMQHKVHKVREEAFFWGVFFHVVA